MLNVSPDQRGVVSALLSLARNLGLITGVSAMGAVFAITSGAPDITTASQNAIITGMHRTFTVAAILICLTLVIGNWRKVESDASFHPSNDQQGNSPEN
jgi:hypothetical protein